MSFDIDWTQPWYSSVRAAGVKIKISDWISEVNRQATDLSIKNHRGLSLSFVNQAELPENLAYEAFISSTGKVPTRDNTHDFFNALVWLNFPNIKRELNAIQAEQIEHCGIHSARGNLRDAATVFDENASLLVIRDKKAGHQLAQALQAHEWISLFINQRQAFMTHTELWIFGHALMEKLLNPYKSITAHTRIIMTPDHYFSKSELDRKKWVDLQLAEKLKSDQKRSLSMSWFTPLPILGIPNWWPEQNLEFYTDTQVFRPHRTKLKDVAIS